MRGRRRRCQLGRRPPAGTQADAEQVCKVVAEPVLLQTSLSHWSNSLARNVYGLLCAHARRRQGQGCASPRALTGSVTGRPAWRRARPRRPGRRPSRLRPPPRPQPPARARAPHLWLGRVARFDHITKGRGHVSMYTRQCSTAPHQGYLQLHMHIYRPPQHQSLTV